MTNTIVIVGAGQAGLQTAVSLRQGGFDGRIILLGEESHAPYQRPPLSKQVLKGEFSAEKCTLRQPAFLEQQRIDFRPESRAASLDTARRTVSLDSGRVIDYDQLVIATGARLNRIELEGSTRSGVHYLRTIDDALALHEKLAGGGRLVVAGGGYIGLEVAASARAMGCDVAVVEVQDGIMQRSALPQIADWLEARHRKAGVTFHFGRRMTAIHGARNVQAVSLDDGTLIDADVVLKGLGVQPRIDWLEGSAVATARGVLVDAQCRTSAEGVYAAGDCTETAHPYYPEPVVLESVQNAVSQGKLCAANLLGGQARYEEPPWFWSEQYDCRLQMAGLPGKDDELVQRDNGPNSITVLSMNGNQLRAIQCINAPRDYMAARKLIASGTAIDPARVQDINTELKDLL